VRVALDHRPARFGRGGIAVYVREIAEAYARTFPDDDVLLWEHRFRRPAPSADPPSDGLPANARLLSGRFPSRAQTLLARVGLGIDRLVGGCDVVHWTDYVSLPTTDAPVVATVHDVCFDELPSCFTAEMRRGLRAVTTRIAREARRILVPSARTAEDLALHYGVEAGRVVLAPHGVPRLPDVPPATDLGRYVLFVGTLEPRKNLLRLVEAWRRGARGGEDAGLVVAGARGWLDEPIVRALSAPRVTWVAGASRERLAALYRGAALVAYPSLGEGFGLPVLEAMAAGRPAVVGRGTACEEVGGDAVLAADPRDVDALAGAIRRLLDDRALASALGERGVARARAFTWERAARRTRLAYEGAVAG
jgi:glycosyltransferase involved in cell wall biosynthesis